MATKAITTPDGQQLYAPCAAWNHGEKKPMRECEHCGEAIVWCKSKKTGRFYPAEVVNTGNYGARKYVPWKIHKCRR